MNILQGALWAPSIPQDGVHHNQSQYDRIIFPTHFPLTKLCNQAIDRGMLQASPKLLLALHTMPERDGIILYTL